MRLACATTFKKLFSFVVMIDSNYAVLVCDHDHDYARMMKRGVVVKEKRYGLVSEVGVC